MQSFEVTQSNISRLTSALAYPFHTLESRQFRLYHIFTLTARGNDAILVLADTLSKMARFFPTTKTVTAEATVQLLADRLSHYQGFPQVLISDRDPRFQSCLWRQLCHRFNIKHAMPSAHRPQSN